MIPLLLLDDRCWLMIMMIDDDDGFEAGYRLELETGYWYF